MGCDILGGIPRAIGISPTPVVIPESNSSCTNLQFSIKYLIRMLLESVYKFKFSEVYSVKY